MKPRMLMLKKVSLLKSEMCTYIVVGVGTNKLQQYKVQQPRRPLSCLYNISYCGFCGVGSAAGRKCK